MVVETFGTIFIQDVDAEAEADSKEKEQFKVDCSVVILQQLFDGPGLAEKISKELGKYNELYIMSYS